MGELQTVQTAIDFIAAYDPISQTGDFIVPIIIALVAIVCISCAVMFFIKKRQLNLESIDRHASLQTSSMDNKSKAWLWLVGIIAVTGLIFAGSFVVKNAFAGNANEYQVNTPSMVHASVDPVSGVVDIESGYIENASSDVLNISMISTYGFPGVSDGGATWKINIFDNEVYSTTCGTDVSQTPSILLQPGQRAQISYSVNIDPGVAKNLMGKTVIAATFGIEKAYNVKFSTNYPALAPYSPFNDIYVPSQGTSYTYHETGEGYSKEVSITINYGDVEFSVFPYMTVEGWHNEYTNLNDSDEVLVDGQTGDITSDSKFVTTIILNSYDVIVDLGGGDIVWDKVPEGWYPIVQNDSNEYTRKYHKTYYYGDVVYDILNPSTERGWADPVFNRDITRVKGNEHYFLHNHYINDDELYPWDTDPNHMITEDLTITLLWDATSYIEGHVYLPEGGVALGAKVEYWTDDASMHWDTTTNMYGTYRVEVPQVSEDNKTAGVLKISMETQTNDANVLCAPDIFVYPDNWTIKVGESHLQGATIISGTVRANPAPNIFGAEDTPLEDVIVTLYTYVGDTNNGPQQVEATYSTRTNENGIYTMYVVKRETTLMQGYLEMYSSKFDTEYVRLVRLDEKDWHDYTFSRESLNVKMDFAGASLPEEKLPYSWKFDSDGNITKNYQPQSWIGAIEQEIDVNDLVLEGPHKFIGWDCVPVMSQEQLIEENTVLTAQWAKIIPIPKAVDGLVYNGLDQVGVPVDEGYTIIENNNKNAGNYIAHAFTRDGYVWEDDYQPGERLIRWKIDQKSLHDCDDISIPDEFKDIEYSGNKIVPPITVKDEVEGHSIISADTDYYIDGTLYATNVGNYTITVAAKQTGNYTGAVFIDWNIRAQRVPLPSLITEEALYYKCDAEGVGIEQIAVDVSECNDRYTYMGEKATDAGAYHFMASLNDPYNYSWETDPEIKSDVHISWIIFKQEVPIPSAIPGLIYNGQEQTGVEFPAGEFRYNLFNNTAVEAGKYTCVASLKDRWNFCWKDNEQQSNNQEIQWQIIKKKVPIPTKIEETLIYDGTVKLGVRDAYYGAPYKITNNRQVHAGKYSAIASFFHPENYAWDDGSEEGTSDNQWIDWEILKQTIKRPVANEGLIYNGMIQEGVSYYDEEHLFSLSNNQNRNSGTYVAKADLINPSDYQWEAEEGQEPTSLEITIEWMIDKKDIADPSVKKIVVDGKDKEFTGETITPIIQISDTIIVEGHEQEIIKPSDYKLGGETSGLHVKVNNGEIENYVISVDTAAIEKGNYKGSDEIPWTIVTHMMNIPSAVQGLVYNGIEQHGVLVEPNSYGYSLVNNFSDKAGTYEATAVVVNSVDYPKDVAWDLGLGMLSYDNQNISWSIAKKNLADIYLALVPSHYIYDQGNPLGPPTYIEPIDYIYEVGGTAVPIITENDYYIDGPLDPQTDIGSYPITAIAKDDGNYFGSVTNYWTIDEAEADPPKPVTNLVYNGTAQTGVELYEDAYFYNKDQSSTVPDPECVKETNAGTYTVWAHLNHGWKWKDTKTEEPRSVTFIIAKKSINSPSVEITPDQTSFTYKSAEQGPNITVSDYILGPSGEHIEIIDPSKDFRIEGALQRNAGEYTATITTENCNGNYTIYEAESYPTIDWEITKAPVSINWFGWGPSGESFETTYNGNSQAPTCAVAGKIGSDDLGCETKIRGHNEAINAGNYTAYAQLTGNDAGNYNIVDHLEKDFTIKRQPVKDPIVKTGLVYNGDEQVGVVPYPGTEDLVYGTLMSGIDALPYLAQICLWDIDNYYWESSPTPDINFIHKSWEIAPREIEMRWDTKGLPYTYNFDTQAPDGEISNLCSVLLIPDVVFPIIDLVWGDNGKDAGWHTVEVTGIIGTRMSNYKLPDSPLTYTYQILPREVQEPVPEDYSNWRYCGTEYDILPDKPKYYSTYGDVETNAGEHTWHAELVEDTGNLVWKGSGSHNILYGTWYILPRSVDNLVVVCEGSPLPYTGDSQLPKLDISDSCFVDINKDLTISNYVEQKDVGVYPFTITGNPYSNYTDSKNYTWEIANLTVDKPTAEIGLIYNGNPLNGIKDNGQVGYKLTNNINTNAGTYTATATLDPGYSWTDGSKDDLNIEYTIAQKDISKAIVSIDGESEFTYHNEQYTVNVVVSLDCPITDQDYVVENNSAINRGSYTIGVTAVEGGNFTGTCETTPTWNIHECDIYSIITWSQETDKYTYDGHAHGPDAAITAEWASSLSLTITYTDKQVEANSEYYDESSPNYWYHSVITGIYGDDYFNFFIDEQNEGCKYHIGPAEVPIPTAKTGLVYDGTEKTMCLDIDPDYSSVIEVTDASATDAGTYTAHARLTDGSVIWKDYPQDPKGVIDISYTIAKCVVTPQWPEYYLEYDGQVKYPPVNANPCYDENELKINLALVSGDEGINAGNHQVDCISLSGSRADNYELDNNILSHEFSVAQRDFSNVLVTLDPVQAIFTGQDITVNVFVGDKVQDIPIVWNDDYTYTGETAKEKGYHDVVVTPKDSGNYKGADITARWEIADKKPGFINGDLPNVIDTVYTGETFTLSDEYSGTVGVDCSGPIHYVWTDSAGTTLQDQTMPITASDAGDYYLKIYAEATSEYTSSDFYDLGIAHIRPAEISYAIDEKTTSEFSGNPFVWGGVLWAQPVDGSNAEIKYRDDNTGLYTLDVPPAKTYVVDSGNVGYQISAKNHELIQDEREIKVTPAEISVGTIEDQIYYYNGSLQGEPIDSEAIATRGGMPFTITYKYPGHEEGTDVFPQLMNAGESMTVNYIVSAENHYDKEGYYKLEILGKDKGYITPVPYAPQLTYNGEAQNLVAFASDFIASGPIKYRVGDNISDEMPTGINAGDYSIYVFADETEQFSKSDEYLVQTTISPAQITDITISGTETKAFDTTPTQRYVTPNLPYGGIPTVEYSLTGEVESYSTDVPSFVDVVDTTVYYRITCENYVTVNDEYSVIITPLDIGYTCEQDQNKIYDAQPFNGTGVENVDVKYGMEWNVYYGTSEESCESTDRPSITNVAESCTVYFKIVAKNHKTETGSYNLNINPATLNKDKVPDIQKFDYTGSLLGDTIEVDDISGKPVNVMYGWEKGDYNLPVAQQTDPGEYTVYYLATAENHNDLEESYTLEIDGPSKQDGYINPIPPSLVDNLVYTGGNIKLLDIEDPDLGYTYTGDVVYYVEGITSGWITEAPTTTKTGIYNVKCKALESEQFYESQEYETTVYINYKAEFYNAGSSSPVDTQLVPRDNAEYKLNETITSEKGWYYIGKDNVYKWDFDNDIVDDNIILYNAESVQGLDYYTLDQLKIAAQDISAKGVESPYYLEFAYYCAAGEIWYSNSNGRQDPDNPDPSLCNQEYKCNFTHWPKAPKEIDQFLFLRIIGVNHDYLSGDRSYIQRAGLTFETVNAIPYNQVFFEGEEEAKSSTWENSLVRQEFIQWANDGSVIPSAFTDRMESAVKFTYNFEDNVMEKTDDKIFILSVSEMNRYYSKANPTGWEQAYLASGRDPVDPTKVIFNPDGPITDGFCYEWYIWNEHWSGNNGPYEHEYDQLFELWCNLNSGKAQQGTGVHGVRLRTHDAYGPGYYHSIWNTEGNLDSFEYGDDDQHDYHIAFCF